MQFRDFVIELLRQEVDIVFVGLKARTIGPWPSGKTKRFSEVDVVDFQAFKALQASKVEVVRRAVHNLCVFAHQGIGVPVAMHTTVSEGVHFQVSAAATDGCWDAATSLSDTALPLPQQLAVWHRDAFWKREPKSQNNPSRRTGPEDALEL